MSEHTPAQAPEPFDPHSANEVAARFNEGIAAQWLTATTHRRKAMIKQLLTLEAHKKKHHEEETANRVILIDDELDEDAEDERLAARRTKTFLLTGNDKATGVIQANRDLYLADIVMKQALLQRENVQNESRVREDISTRCVQIHVLNLLLDGRLAFAELKAIVDSDERCSALTPLGIEYEYDALLDRLIIKRFVTEERPPSAS